MTEARVRTRIFHVTNKGSDDDDESDDEGRPTNGGYLGGYRTQPQTHPIGRSNGIGTGTGTGIAAGVGTGTSPAPLTTNIPPRGPRYQPSHHSLSSPSSTSSPAADESTPPPSTPGLPAPPVDLTADAADSQFDPPTSRTGRFMQSLRSPFHPKSPRPSKRPATSPTGSTPDSFSNSSPAPTEKVNILVTADSEKYVNVDITGAKSPAVIKECVFTKLNIYDEEDQSRFSIYQTEIGAYATSDALSDERLFELCRTLGDSKGTLKLLVSHSSATVHEHSYSIRPLPSVSPSSVGTIPPPVLPEHSSQPYPPLRPKRRSGSKRDGSISSTSEHIPLDSTGYDADLDNPERDNRSTMRPPPQQMLNAIANTVSPPSPLSTRRSGAPLPSRPNSPPTPPTAPLPQPPTDGKDATLPAGTIIDRYGNVVPTPPPPPPLSPSKSTFPINEDNSLTPPATRTHRRSGSDVAAEREQTFQSSEHQFEMFGRQWRSQQQQPSHRSKQESPQLREGHRERPRPNVLQRSDHDDSPAKLDSWVFVSKIEPSGGATKAARGEHEQSLQQAPSSSSDKSTRSPASSSRAPRNHVSPSRYKPSSSYSTRLAIPAPPRNPPPSVPAGASESRLPVPSRNAGQPVPANWAVVWKGEEKNGDQKPLSSSPSRTKWPRLGKGAKSMDELRAAFSGTGSNSNHPPTLQPGDRSRRGQNQIPITRNNGGITFMPGSFGREGSGTLSKAYESTRPYARPLPMHGGNTQDLPSASVPNSYSSNNRYGSSGAGYTSPYQEPYPRPLSALGDSITSPTTRVQRQYQSPTYAMDMADSIRSSRAMSPTLPFSIMGSRSATALVDSSGSANGGDSHTRTQTNSRTPPRSPTSPRGSKLFPNRLSDGSYGSTGSGGSDSTLRKGEHQWLTNLLNDPGVNGLASDATLVPLRPLHPLPDPLSASSATSSALSSSTLTPTSSVPSSASSSSSSTLAKSFPPSKSIDASLYSPYSGFIPTNMTTGTFDDSDSDDLWNRPLGPVPTNKSSLCRPALTVQIENGNGVVKPVPIASSSSSSSHHVTSGLPPSSSTPTPLRRPSSPSPKTSGNGKGRIRGSTFTMQDSDEWAPRPLPEDMYEKLDQYFPEHDLDKPVIEACSGGTSPTAVEPSVPVPPMPPLPLDIEYPRPERERDFESKDKDKARIRGKKSIRIVAQEHKKRIDRTSMASSYSASNANMMRKRSTKLWGSKLEEVTTAHGKSSAAVTPDSPSGGPTTFKWVRGELIGRGTYGRVYLALNATTGEMIAVKQVDIPRTASDKNDSRQTNVVQALKLESETLKDLDHPNIVQYLGFEETPSNLSIFLEYVPGGSIGSVLLKHGKFAEDVTKSFTGQILSGLEYLHSKGILHRDLKADNILVEMSGICKISDFGISKRTAEDAGGGAATAMQGTVFWMAPEVVNPQGKGYNFKVDIWSVGCVVLEMWAGMRPWMGDEMVAVMFKLYSSKLPPPVPEDIVLSELADDFRKKCFAMNPDERPSAAELRKHKYLELPPGWVFNGFTS